jgi:ribose/xylose/arabinose/galactoside ABC-type transport system permease subunit
MSSTSSATERLRLIFFHRHETKLGTLLLVLGIGLAITAPRFFSSVNLALLARSMGILLILSVGMLNVILAGGIDVSAGAILAVVSVVLVRLGNHGLPAPVVLPLGLLTGAGLGAVNAALIAELRIPPIVATLGTAGLFRGLLLEWTQGEWESSIPPWLNTIGSPRWGGLDASVLAAALAMLAAAWILHRTQIGRALFRFGDSPTAAARSGISRRQPIYFAYISLGLLTAIGAIFYAAQLGAVQGNAANGYELTVIAAVVLGGADILGGRGSLFGTFLGVLLLCSLQQALVLLHVATYWQNIATGAIVLLGVILSSAPRLQRTLLLQQSPSA